jgi:hypothetical protein
LDLRQRKNSGDTIFAANRCRCSGASSPTAERFEGPEGPKRHASRRGARSSVTYDGKKSTGQVTTI